MKLTDHYNKLWEQSLQKFKREEFEFDPIINSENDTRYGITLLVRPSKEVKQNISTALQQIKATAPNQYYYPSTDLHITILSIISCYAGFTLDEIDQSEYQKLVHSAINLISPFNINFRGLTASPSCIMVQGFPKGNQLEKLRSALRSEFKQSNLQHSIDKRYRLQTAHMTVIRFKEPFVQSEKFIKTVADFRDRNFGSCVVNQLELVGNDWYQQKEKIKLVDKFTLSKQEQS
ncbi:MAG: hypothetical protein U5K69_15435 [Balneolaceae bacterium]|nr:hypothetical protein [Balneolaceae bacterium]